MEDALCSGARALGLQLSDTQIRQLLGYAALLQKWGSVYNLTAVRDAHEALARHVLDSLAVVAPLRAMCHPSPSRLIDVGSGAGLPGALIGAMCPDIQVDCVDAVAKKSAFVRQAALELGLSNVHAVHARVEKLSGSYDVAISRAFASLSDFVRLTEHLVREGGLWMAMKGKYPADEVAELPDHVELFHVEHLRVPGSEAERCLLWIRRRAG